MVGWFAFPLAELYWRKGWARSVAASAFFAVMTTVAMAGVEYSDVLRMGNELLRDNAAYAKMAHAVNPYGDGNACRRIADAIEWHFGRRGSRPVDYLP